jgi:hypothetical protein
MLKSFLSFLWSFTTRRERRDPTLQWQADIPPKLIIDLAASSLCGVRSGEPVSCLHFLGPCEQFMPIGMYDDDGTGWWWVDRSYSLAYHSLGLTVWFDHEMSISSFELVIDPREEPKGTKPFVGCFQWEGRELTVSDFVNCDSVRRVLGEPSRLTEPTEAEQQAFEGQAQRFMKYYQYERANAMFVFDDSNGSTIGLSVGHNMNEPQGA